MQVKSDKGPCGAGFEYSVLFISYKSNGKSGIDKFTVYLDEGGRMSPVPVTVTIGGGGAASAAEPAQEEQRPAPSSPRQREPVVAEPKVPAPRYPAANEVFDAVAVGSTFTFKWVDQITQKTSDVSATVTEKTAKELTLQEGNQTIVLNPNFERIKIAANATNGRACDGISVPFRDGGHDQFSFVYNGRSDAGENFRIALDCTRTIGASKTVTVMGRQLTAYAVTNVALFNGRNEPKGFRKLSRSGFFSPDIANWVEIDFSETHGGRTFKHWKAELTRYNIPSTFQVETSVCKTDCATALPADKLSMLQPTRYNSLDECTKVVAKVQSGVAQSGMYMAARCLPYGK